MDAVKVFINNDEFTRMVVHLLEFIKSSNVAKQIETSIILFQYINHNIVEYYSAYKPNISERFICVIYNKILQFEKDNAEGKYNSCVKQLLDEWLVNIKLAKRKVYSVIQNIQTEIRDDKKPKSTQQNSTLYDVTQNITNIITMPYWIIAGDVQ